MFNSTVASKKTPAGLILSEDEDTAIVLNGTDHIRLHMFSPGLHLDELWTRCDQMDDFINARFPYAFDKKYGYLTSFPTNVGTGMRASVVLHLPTLSLGKSSTGWWQRWAGSGLLSVVYTERAVRIMELCMRFPTKKPWV